MKFRQRNVLKLTYLNLLPLHFEYRILLTHFFWSESTHERYPAFIQSMCLLYHQENNKHRIQFLKLHHPYRPMIDRHYSNLAYLIHYLSFSLLVFVFLLFRYATWFLLITSLSLLPFEPILFLTLYKHQQVHACKILTKSTPRLSRLVACFLRLFFESHLHLYHFF